MYHYVYYSYEEWGRGYIGVRSCKCLPEEDTKYFGSFYDKTFKPTSKVILSEFPDRESAIAAEVKLHAFYQVHKNSHFANKARQTSTKFVSNGEGMKKCLELYPDFQSRAGKVGGKRTQELYPEMASCLGKEAIKNLRKWHEENPELSKLAGQRAGLAGIAYFRNNPEAARKRAANGVKAMKEYWDKVGMPPRKGKNGTELKVQMPCGQIKVFPSINVAADKLGIPATTMKRMAKGQHVKRYKDYKVTPSAEGYTETVTNQHQ